MPKKQKKPASPPTYAELADLVCLLAETNIANINTVENRFVSCFTFGSGNAPDHWHRALAAREALIENKMATRQNRHDYDREKIRTMRTKS